MRLLPVSAVLVTTLPFLGGCSTAPEHHIESEHLAPDWHGQPYRKLLVIGLYDDRGMRVSQESVFAAELAERGVAAVAGYEVFADLPSLEDLPNVRRKLESLGCDAVLSVATLDASEGAGEGWHAAESWIHALGGETRILRGVNAYRDYSAGAFSLGISLWDASSLTEIWTATTDSYDLDTGPGAVGRLADFVVRTLSKRGLL